MKKAVLALVLLAVIVGVGYLSANRNQAHEKGRYQDGYAKGLSEVANVRKEADSIRTVMQKHEVTFTDSLKNMAARDARQIDSLEKVVAGRDSMLAVLRKKGSSQTAKQARAPARSATKPDALTHTQVLDYYKKRLSQLPADLSDYERKVAVNEIRDETIRKFSISAADLDRMRQSSNVSE